MTKPRIVDEADPRICKVCGVAKSLAAFGVYRHLRQADTHDRTCKTCRAADQVRRRRNDPTFDRITMVSNERRRRQRMERLFQYYEDHPCVDCGETDPVVLDFDHIDPGQKTQIVSRMMLGQWDGILAEIAKCEVRCSNCHRRRTAAQFGWYAYQGQDHDAIAAEAIHAIRAAATGQQRFELEAEPELADTRVVLLGLAEHLTADRLWEVGERVVVMTRCRVDPLGQGVALAVEDAVVVDRAEVEFLNMEGAAHDAS